MINPKFKMIELDRFDYILYMLGFNYKRTDNLYTHLWNNTNIECWTYPGWYGSIFWVDKVYFLYYCTYKPNHDDEIIEVYKFNNGYKLNLIYKFVDQLTFIESIHRPLFVQLLKNKIII